MASSLAHVILSFLLHVLCLLVGPRALAAPIPSAVGEDAWSFFTIGDWVGGFSSLLLSLSAHIIGRRRKGLFCSSI